MAEFTLTAQSALDNYNTAFDGGHLAEITDLAIVSLAFPRGQEKEAEKATTTAFGVALPDVGSSVNSAEDRLLVHLSQGQLFAIYRTDDRYPEREIARAIQGLAYTTDQTDVWVALELSGQNARSVLERICPIDLHSEAFAIGSAARTIMEHLGTLIIRTDADTYLLMSARSSAKTFLHALETSILNTAG